MSATPDYSSYTLDQLQDVAAHVDRERFPDRYAVVMAEIRRRLEDGGEVFEVYIDELHRDIDPPVESIPPAEAAAPAETAVPAEVAATAEPDGKVTQRSVPLVVGLGIFEILFGTLTLTELVIDRTSGAHTVAPQIFTSGIAVGLVMLAAGVLLMLRRVRGIWVALVLHAVQVPIVLSERMTYALVFPSSFRFVLTIHGQSAKIGINAVALILLAAFSFARVHGVPRHSHHHADH